MNCNCQICNTVFSKELDIKYIGVVVTNRYNCNGRFINSILLNGEKQTNYDIFFYTVPKYKKNGCCATVAINLLKNKYGIELTFSGFVENCHTDIFNQINVKYYGQTAYFYIKQFGLSRSLCNTRLGLAGSKERVDWVNIKTLAVIPEGSNNPNKHTTNIPFAIELSTRKELSYLLAN